MAKTADRVTRFDADLFEAAAAEGRRQARSASQQLAHWARVGRSVSATETSSRKRVENALAGVLPVSELDDIESVVFNAEVTAAIEENLGRADYARDLLGGGVTVVFIEDGDLVQQSPDGTRVVLAENVG